MLKTVADFSEKEYPKLISHPILLSNGDTLCLTPRLIQLVIDRNLTELEKEARSVISSYSHLINQAWTRRVDLELEYLKKVYIAFVILREEERFTSLQGAIFLSRKFRGRALFIIDTEAESCYN